MSKRLDIKGKTLSELQSIRARHAVGVSVNRLRVDFKLPWHTVHRIVTMSEQELREVIERESPFAGKSADQISAHVRLGEGR